jgi:hypothetical protein
MAWSNPKTNKGECECAPRCGRFGTLGRPDRLGARHVRGCDCWVCLGRHSKRNGGRKQAKAVTTLGIPRSSLRPGHEELLGGTVRVEVKSGAQVSPVLTRYLAAESQSESQRPIGDHRPFAFLAMPEDTSDGLVVVRLSAVHEFAAALVEMAGAQ